ncbi:MAG TPA: endo-1,4-beta-xylanase [Chitinispirillaceae bacterium]|nr:endo-1,4-beta-xylanase [Chitinispirillaceae bacterium]
MMPKRTKPSVLLCGLFLLSFFKSDGTAQNYNYSHRMRDCNVVVKSNGQTLSGAKVSVKQIRNHFGFGASINRWAFDTLGEEYGKTFLKYFDYATPENEMKWPSNQWDTVKVEPYYGLADYIIDFCKENDILVRGHNLFWNEKTDWLPKYTLKLSKTEFKQAMQERIDDAIPHFKGKVVQWDVINEIVHGANGSTPTVTMLDSASGDPDIFKWILQEARKKDPDCKFVINDYNLIEQYDAIDKFVAKVKPLSDYYDIVGCEGHFGEYMVKSSYEQKINKIAEQLGKPIWLTEVDFTLSGSVPDKVEELLRTCFANKNVEGVIFWIWHKRKMWREMNSYLVDSLLQETPTGKRWRDVREEWKTKDSGTTDNSGKYSFNGYQGKYIVTTKVGDLSDVDTIYLEPGSGAKTCEVTYNPVTTNVKKLNNSGSYLSTALVNGKMVNLNGYLKNTQNVYLSAFTISGKLIANIPVDITSGVMAVKVPTGCHIFRISTDKEVLYTGMGFQL